MPPTNKTTDVALTAEMKTYYDRVLLERALPRLVHTQFGQQRPIPRNGGKAITATPTATTFGTPKTRVFHPVSRTPALNTPHR